MAQTTRFFGLALIAVGIVGYVATDAVSVTALIPAFFGVVLVILAWLARNERHREHALHPELDPVRYRRDDFGVFGGGVLIGPERRGGDSLALGREVFPEVRRKRRLCVRHETVTLT